MFTFQKPKADQNPIFFINEKSVFTQFKKDDKLRIPPFKDSQNFLESEEYEERKLKEESYIKRLQARRIAKCLYKKKAKSNS